MVMPSVCGELASGLGGSGSGGLVGCGGGSGLVGSGSGRVPLGPMAP